MKRHDTPSFSRPDRASIFGKRTEAARTLLASPTKQGLEQLWRRLGYRTESQFLAELIEIRVHGVEHVAKVHDQRARAVAGIEQE